MISIRELTEEDMQQAIELRILSWTEELAGRAENTLSLTSELDFWVNWMNSSEANNDIRLLIGAFEKGQMLGVAFGSFAETHDVLEKGVELNGLWVYPQQRNRGISLMLLNYLLNFYLSKGMAHLVIYNHHDAPSNQFYRKFGAEIARQEYQGNNSLLIDVFITDIETIKHHIGNSLKRYL